MNDDEFKKKLNREQYRVMREDGIETEFTGRYWDNEKDGIYRCVACGNALFSSREKFDAGTGWPSFHKPMNEKDLEYEQNPDINGRMRIRCKKCHSNIGHIIDDKGGYYRVNSIALKFEEHDRLAMLENVKGKLEDVQKQVEKQDDGAAQGGERASAFESVLSNVSGIAQLLGGGLIGVVVGAAAAFLYCQATCAAPSVATSTQATTSAPVATSSTPATLPSTTPRTPRATLAPASSGSVTPAPGTGTADVATTSTTGSASATPASTAP